MKAHTSNFKEQIKTMGRELDSIITFGDTVLGNEQLNAVTPSFQSDILKSVMKQLDIDSNVLIPIGTILNYKFGVKVNGDYEYINFGNYVVKDVEKQEDTNSYKITCYDRMLFAMRDYVKMPITYPITIRDYINSLCTFLGLTFANKNDEFANYDKEIPNELYLNSDGNSIGYTFRDVFDELAQVTASTICINETDEVEIRYVGENKNYEEIISNNSIVIKNNIGNNALSYNIEGKCEQETRSGKNLFKGNTKSMTRNGLTSTYSDVNSNEVSISGTSTDTWSDISKSMTDILPSGTYTMSISEPQNFEVRIKGTYEDNTIFEFKILKGSTYRTFTTTKNIKTRYFYIIGITSGSAVTTKFKIQLEPGSIPTEIEQYGASPSPDYPSEIKTVKGIRNLFDYSNHNNFFKPNLSWFEVIDNGIRVHIKDVNNKTYQYGGYIFPDLIKNLGKTFTISCEHKASGNNIGAIKLYWCTETSLKGWFYDLTANGGTFTLPTSIPSGVTDLVILFYGNTNKTEVTTDDYVDYTNIQLEESPIPHDYVPYGSWLKNKVTGKNLFDFNDFFNKATPVRCTKTLLTNGIRLTATGSADAWIGDALKKGATVSNIAKSIAIKVKENTSYTFKASIMSYNFISYCDKDFNVLNDNYILIPNGTSYTFITPSETKYIVLRLGKYFLEAGSIDFTDIQLEENTVATEYEPYKEQEVLIDMNKPNLLDDVEWEQGGVSSGQNEKYEQLKYETNIRIRFKNTLKLDNLKKYTVECNEGYDFIFQVFDENGNYYVISEVSNVWFTNNKKTISNIKNLSIAIRKSDNTDITINDLANVNLKLYEGYNPYYELASIGDTKDNLEVVSGGLTKRIGKVVLNGSEDWILNGNQFAISGVNYKTNSDGALWLNTHFQQNVGNDKSLWIGNTAFIVIRYDEFKTTDELKKWLSENPVTVYYELAEPEIIQLTPTNVPLFDGINNISLLEDLETNTSIKYQIEYDTIDEEYLKDVNVNFGEKYGPINSIVLSRAGESDNIYLQDEKSIEENGLCELKISENQIMNFNDRDKYLPDILDKLNGLKYYLNDFTSTGVTYYDVCDRYNVKIGDNIYPCIMFNDEVLVTQGLQENVYTEMPEESETDYTKADKTDRRINQTYLIVDKQNQKIESLVNKIVDVSTEKSGTNSITLENAHEGQLHYLSIKGNISLLFPSSKENLYGYPLVPSENLTPNNTLTPSAPIYKDNKVLYPSNELFSKSNALLIDDEEYKLDIDFLNYLNNTDCDEFIYEDGKCKIIRRLGVNESGELYKLENEIVEQREDIVLNVKSDSTIKMKSFENTIFKVIYLLENEYSNYFATNVELNSKIEQTAEEINLEVSKKVGNDEVISRINQSAEAITILANKLGLTANDIINLIAGNSINLTSKNITIDSDNFSVDKNGKLNCSNANITGGNIVIPEGNGGHGMEVYGSLGDVTYYTQQRAAAYNCYRNGILTARLHDASTAGGGVLQLFDSSGTNNITLSGNTGTITCISLTQTSLEKNKKNFEKFNGALNVINDIDLYKYNLINEKDTDKKHIGFVIGENFKYSSEITALDEEGKEIGVDNYSMTSLCLQAIKEQQEIINELKEEINKIKESDK